MSLWNGYNAAVVLNVQAAYTKCIKLCLTMYQLMGLPTVDSCSVHNAKFCHSVVLVICCSENVLVSYVHGICLFSFLCFVCCSGNFVCSCYGLSASFKQLIKDKINK